MNINGSLVFDGSSASEVKNLRIEKKATLPIWVDTDVGRLVYDTGATILYVGGATAWVPLATGGDASALLTEVDAIETALNLNDGGTWKAAGFTGNLAGSTSLTNLIGTIQGLIATAQSTAAGAVSVNTTQTADIATAQAAAVAAQATADGAVSVNTTQAGLITTAQSTANGAVTQNGVQDGLITTLRTDVNATVVVANAAAAGLATEITDRVTDVNAEETRALAAEGVLATATALVQTHLDTEATTRGGADTTLQTNINTEATARAAGDATNLTAIGAETTRATAAEAALSASADAFAQGLSWKDSVSVATVGPIDLASATTGYDTVTLSTGDRVLVRAQTAPAENGIYIFNGVGQALTRSVDMNAPAEFLGATVYVAGGTQVGTFTETATVATVGTTPVAFAQVTGAGVALVAGAGLAQSGNNFDIGATDTSITVSDNSIAVSDALQTAISTNTSGLSTEVTNRTNADTALGTRIDNEITARGTAITDEVAARNTAIGVETSRATAAEGVIAGNLATEITNRGNAVSGEATARGNADTTLQGNIDAEATARGNADTTQATATALVQTHLDTEATTRGSADTAINARIGKMYFLYNGYGDGLGTGDPGSPLAATTHTVNHALGQSYCNVTVVDGTDNVVIPQSIQFITLNQLVVTFNSAILCRVVCMGLAP